MHSRYNRCAFTCMKTAAPSFAQLHATPGEPALQVDRISGTIKNVFPRITKPGFDIQNFFLEEDGSGHEIKCGWFDLDLDLKKYEGGYVELESTANNSLVWKKQNGRETITKMEIRKAAQVIHLLTAKENPGPLMRESSIRSPRPAAAPTGFPARQELREKRVLARAASEVPQVSAAGLPTEGNSRLRYIGQLHVQCLDEAVDTVAEMRAAHEKRKAAGGEAPPSINFDRMLELTYLSIASAAVGSSPFPALRALDDPPIPDAHSPLSQLAAVIGENEAKANETLVIFGKIRKGQTFRDLNEADAAELIRNHWKVA